MNPETEDETPAPAKSRRALLLIVAAVVLVAAFLGGRLLAPHVRGGKPAATSVATPSTPTTTPAPTAGVTEAAPPPAAAAEGEPRSRRPRKAPSSAPAAPAAPAAPTSGELRIDSDVPGAMVFLDRVYLGAAPITAGNVAPGQHQLNVSAEGYDGYSESIQVEPGPRDITVRFKEVRLNEALEVVHRHAMGSCEGRLVADPQGVRYETSNKGDAFSLKFAEIETFEVDYLKKNLRLKRRGGKTWNFTTKTENADPLFVFHRTVNKVRVQVAGRK